jgi:hypothetical protein
MPIRLENSDRYPADWPQISARVRMEAGDMCEWCGVVNGRMIRRGTDRDGRRVYRYADDPAFEDGRDARTGEYVPDTGEDTCDWRPAVRVVLTVAHLDHQPENCARENLRALCQACHNAYDAPMRARGIAERKRAAQAIADLFQEENTP